MNVLLVKMSSLGDVVHTLPAVHDATRAGARVDWVIEEAFAPVAELARGAADAAPAVRVLPVAIRRWRSAPLRHAAEIRAFRERLRERRYDVAIDAQGLIKSAAVALCARAGVRAGFDGHSVRELPAALAYDRRLAIPRRAHAVERLRELFARAIGYQLPSDAPAFDLRLAPAVRERAVLLHGAAWGTKQWPERHWIAIARRCGAAGLEPVLFWHSAEERARAERIAAAAPRARVCERMDLGGVVDVLASARLVVGVDTGLAHLAAAMGRPTVMLFGPTDPALTGALGDRAVSLDERFPCSPCLSRRCLRLSGGHGTANGAQRPPPCLVDLSPERVWRATGAGRGLSP